MNFDPNTLYYKMVKYYSQHKNDEDKTIICNEGGTRSSKTWDFFHFLVTYCDHNRNKNKDIYLFRDTMINCKDYTLKEFAKCMNVIGINFNPTMSPRPYFKLWGNNIYFRGLAEEMNMEASPSHLSFVNEALDVETQSQISGILMRCTELFIMDWNPKYTDHWAFDFEKRPNCLFTHSTYKNNKHLPLSVVREIESYNPNNPINVKNGTVDEYRWKVYGLGLRASPEGLVFNNVNYIDTFPEDVEQIAYGIDFGETNETAIVKAGLRLNPKGIKHDLFLQKLFYLPTETSANVIETVKALKINSHIWCDNNQDNQNAGTGWISDMRRAGISAFPTRKFPGSRAYWISTIKSFNIHIVKDPYFRKEQENFKYRVVDGIQLSETEKKYDHLWSATGYAVVGDFRQFLSEE